MNSRERILNAMMCRPVDRVPFVPNLNGYNIRFMPERYHTMPRWEIFRELGIDLLVRFRVGTRIRPPIMLLPPPTGPLTLAGSASRQWAKSMPLTHKIKVKSVTEADTHYMILDTPKGCLRCGWRFPDRWADMPFPVEWLLKTIEDVRIYRFVLDNTVVEPAYDEIVEALEAVGDEGTCEAAGGSSPMMDLVELLMGVETFCYLMYDYPDEIEALMAHLFELHKQEYRLLAESPAPIIISGENTSTSLVSPEYMSRWEFPALNEYSDILHRAGKIHMVHMCGLLHQAMDLLVRAHFDGAHDVAPAPTGDFDFKSDRERLLASGKCLCGGIDATAFTQLEPEEMEIYVQKRLEETAPGTGFLLGSGDTVPFGTSVENLKAVVRAVEQYGTVEYG